MKPARVLHLIDSLHLGGAQEVVMNLIAGANTDRYQHEVATLHGHGIYWDRLKARGVPVHSLSPHKLWPAYLCSLALVLRRGGFDVLHCHLVAANLLGKPIGAVCGVPVILNHDHTNDPMRGESRWLLTLDRWANQFAKHHIAVSASCRDFLVQREQISPERVSLILNAIDFSHFETRAKRKNLGAPVIAGVGRLNAQKNFSLFLDVAARVQHRYPEARFVIAGTGPEEQRLREQAIRLGIEERVNFAGYVADPRTIYREADVLMMPSHFEGLPMTLLEAMAAEVPVVASRLDGIAEVVESGVNGLLCTPGLAEEFAARVGDLLSDGELRDRLGKHARETVRTRFSAGRMVAEVEEVYARFLK